MITIARFLSDKQGRQFAAVAHARQPDFASVLASLSRPDWIDRMEAAQRAGQPALSGVIADLEAMPDVDGYFRSHDVRSSERFRKAVGVAVRILMEERGWARTGEKGYLGRRARPIPTVATGVPYNASGISKWFNRSEKYKPAANPGGNAPISSPAGNRSDLTRDEAVRVTGLPPDSFDERGRLREYSAEERQARARRMEVLLDRLEHIGTPEERAETRDYLMGALAESRRAEGRVF